jgi:hypothetical protein
MRGKVSQTGQRLQVCLSIGNCYVGKTFRNRRRGPFNSSDADRFVATEK